MLLEVIYTLTVYKIINVFFTNKKINSVYEKILYAIFNIAVVAVYLKFNIPLLTIVANFIFILLLLSLIYDDTFKRKALVTILIIFFLLISDILLFMIFINAINKNIFQKNNFFDIYVVFIVNMIRYLFVLIVINFYKIRIEKNIPLIFSLPIALTAVISMVITINMFLVINGNNYKFIYINITLIFIVCIVSIYIFNKMVNVMSENARQKILIKQSEYYEKKIEADRKNINDTRKIKHDMKNHMYAIKNMAKNNMSKDIITYTNDILGKIEGEKVYINTGNYLIDGILNVKFEEIKNQGIDFKYDVKIPEGIKLPEFEVITILGNLLDNAIEGVKSIKDNRYIEVFISYKDSNLLIKIVNTFDGLVIKDNKGFVSRKGEKAYHGIGLENVREQVEKSNGYMNIDTGNCMFTVDLFINL
ncbi:MAG: GHKL domain-containing protein [Peptostreptococcus sp.]|uniref:sensor histidine kinase n=1 Tax=Peptostreptococcus sp. TaxID=1262 RepID=UPI001CB46C08|nr:sensor histidine kinase [Peptostreptococcus sp.]MBF1044513.1 GHKL domain-containing protein [Peptostreptococcus sp.]